MSDASARAVNAAPSRTAFYAGGITSRAFGAGPARSTTDVRPETTVPSPTHENMSELPKEGSTRLTEYAAATTTGACRTVNEDAFGIIPAAEAFLVVDGCGGVSPADGAAQLAVQCFDEVLSGRAGPDDQAPSGADPLAHAVIHANAKVFHEASVDPTRRGQGAALCALQVRVDWVGMVHVGDCRVGRYRDGAFVWLTEDHSLVAQMRGTDASPEEIARIAHDHATVITRAIGLGPQVPVDLAYHPTRPGDIYLLCSDGLSRHVDLRRIDAIVSDSSKSLGQRCGALLEATEEAGGSDNATVVLLEAAPRT